MKLAAGLGQRGELAFEVSCVLSATLHVADSSLRCDYEKTNELLGQKSELDARYDTQICVECLRNKPRLAIKDVTCNVDDLPPNSPKVANNKQFNCHFSIQSS